MVSKNTVWTCTGCGATASFDEKGWLKCPCDCATGGVFSAASPPSLDAPAEQINSSTTRDEPRSQSLRSLVNSKNHRPSRELDALIAEKVMGMPKLRVDLFIDTSLEKLRIPSYSTDIAAAWKVVEKHGLGEWNWQVRQTDAGNWFAEVKLGYDSSYSEAFPVWAETAPLAICLAALRALDA